MSAGARPPRELAAAARRGAGLFRLGHRGVVQVAGGDAKRWLDGMISGDVRALGPGHTGCAALALTARGRIVADLQVLWRPDGYWLDLEAPAAPGLVAHFSKYVVADDVDLADRSGEIARLGLEGPAAPRILERALGTPLSLSPHACADVRLAGVDAVAAAFGFSGAPAFQLFAERSAGEAVAEALAAAAGDDELVRGTPEALEILRIEAGVPRLGAELDESVLPAEARLDAAVAIGKGCYTGQEVIERLRTQGKPGHLLVGLAAEGGDPLPVGAALLAGDSRAGEVTSACRSPHAGSIALGFARRASSEVGTQLLADGRPVRVAGLPFVPAAAPGSA